MYKLIRSVLFLFDPEDVHHFAMFWLKIISRLPFVKQLISNQLSPKKPALKKDIFGIEFGNPVGLAAGFDKNASYLNELEMLGFGFVEIGTVTPLLQNGNDRPRVFRLPADKALINRMGFNNEGVVKISERLRKWKSRPQTTNDRRLIIGGNIGKNKITPNEDAWRDYEICFTAMHDYVDYFVVNVSSPNTPGLRELQDKGSLKKILTNLQMLNSKHLNLKPILLKIAPDLTKDQLDDVIALALEIKLDGIIATNTTISRNGLIGKSTETAKQSGGLSGLPVKKRSTEVVQYIFEKTNGTIPIIASGGIFTGEDAKEKFNAGASLIQIWTGFIYEGPAIVKKICETL
jgi:dihydroorotate dehydrogenase